MHEGAPLASSISKPLSDRQSKSATPATVLHAVVGETGTHQAGPATGGRFAAPKAGTLVMANIITNITLVVTNITKRFIRALPPYSHAPRRGVCLNRFLTEWSSPMGFGEQGQEELGPHRRDEAMIDESTEDEVLSCIQTARA